MTYDTSWRTTAATRALDIELPLVLGAFGGASSVELTALVSERGGLGSYGLYGYSAERIAEVARALRGATSKPFALNIWLPLDGNEQVEVTDEQFAAYLKPLLPYFAAVGVEPPAGPPERYLPSFDEQIEAVLDCAPAVVSFVYGVPPAPILDRARALGIRTMATATTVEEAIALDDAGIDAIIASGAEAGGHRVAGGIADGRGLRAALALGADAVLVGSAFLATRQSGAAPVHRAALTSAAAGSTVLTYAMSGRLGRGIANRMTTELRTVGDVAPFPIQNWLTGQFRPAAGTRGMTDYMSLWAGQSSPLIIHDDADALIDALIAAGDG
jgi:nitronate monooxygenase